MKGIYPPVDAPQSLSRQTYSGGCRWQYSHNSIYYGQCKKILERKTDVRMRYSQEADAIYIRLNENKIVNSDEISDGLIADYDENEDIVGIEILWASEKADIDQLIIQSFNKVMVESAVNAKVA